MPIDTEQWRASTGLFCASQRVLLQPPKCKQPMPKVEADTLSLNIKFSLAVVLMTLRTVVSYTAQVLQVAWLIACHTSQLLLSIAKLSCRRLRGVSVLLALCLVVVQMLLLMSGDVEENPGPPKIQTTTLGVNDLSCVRKELLDVSHKWFDIGLELKLSVGTLERLRHQYPDTSTCLREMLLEWLKKVDPPPTWEGLACAMESRVVGEPRLAEQLRTKSCKAEEVTLQMPRDYTQQAQPSTHPSNSVSLHAQYLRDNYQTQIPTFLTLQWPPPPTRKIFNLAMIQGQNIRRGPIDEEMVRLTLRGKVRDILYDKKPIELKDILQMDNAKRKVILIEGAPGSGKSTLAWHVCQTWESGELFQNYRSVVYVQLRDPTIQSAKTIEDLIPAESRYQAKMAMDEFRSCRGRDLLIVLDGWDELPSDLHTKSIFQKLIAFPQTLNLHFSAVIVTSRPIASSDLYRTISSRVEILGFTPSEVKEYFTEALGGESQAVQKLQDQLKESPMVEASCYLPLNAAIVSHLFLAQNYSLPTTLHGVFKLLVVCCLKRHVAKQERETQRITSLDNLPSDIELLFKNVYTLAYHGVMDNKATFPMEYLESRGLPKISETLGLIQGVESFTSVDSSPSFHFLHLSVQELLASFYISKLPGKEQVVVFNTLFGESRFAAVFRFYAAFTKLETEGIREVVARIVQNKRKHQMIYLLHGLYEAQTLSLCQFVYSQLGRKLDLRYTALSPVDCLAVGYFVSCICLTGSGEFEADLDSCSIDSYRVNFLTKELSKCARSASTHKPKLAAIDPGVSRCLELTLSLQNNQVGDEGAALLCGGNVNPSLRTLILQGNGISDEGGRAIAEGLKVNRSLTTLYLSDNGISDEGGIAIAESLKVNQSLTTLHLSSNGLSYNAVSAIAEALKVNQSLTELSLGGNGISDEGGRAIAEGLKVNRSLTTLYLEHNGISDEGGIAIAESLKVNQSLTKLDLDNNGLSYDAVSAIAEALKVNQSLTKLFLGGNGISDEGGRAIAEGLKVNRSLTTLVLQLNQISDEGARAIAAALRVNKSLRELHVWLRWNHGISSEMKGLLKEEFPGRVSC